jgi:hypothetical protein
VIVDERPWTVLYSKAMMMVLVGMSRYVDCLWFDDFSFTGTQI